MIRDFVVIREGGDKKSCYATQDSEESALQIIESAAKIFPTSTFYICETISEIHPVVTIKQNRRKEK